MINIKSTHPEYHSLVTVEPLSLREVQRLVNRDTTLLSYFVTPEKTLAFIITQNSFETVELPVNEKELEETIKEFHNSLNPPPPPNTRIPEVFEHLYTTLIAPLKNHLSTPLIGIISHGILHYLPFSALMDGKHYFSGHYTLFFLPSATVLKFVREKQRSSNNRVFALASSDVAGFPLLHYTDQEVYAIARLYETCVLTGEEATESAFKHQVKDFSVVHLAAHGELNTNNSLFSRILLAPDEENNGALEVHEVYELDLDRSNLVVLSACETKLGEQSRGDDIIGLHRAFIYAGAPSVVASLWKVDDCATRDFMIAFYL